MIALSANLGFLWADRPLPDAIRAAAAAGFDAVECHWPYEHDADIVRAALEESGLPMIGLNTVKGPRDADTGLAAQPGREREARAAIEQAFDYGECVGARGVHVMSGNLNGRSVDDCLACLVDNLGHACDLAAERSMIALIEPLNPYDNPGYALVGFDTALSVLERLDRPEVKLMFDCYHLQVTDGDLLRRFMSVRDRIGHVQFAGVPDRGEPDRGEIAYERLLPAMADAGFDMPFGAEYRPSGPTADTLGWMQSYR